MDFAGNRRLAGKEIDFVLGLEEWTPIQVGLVAAFFRTGAAFGPAPSRSASMQTLKIGYNF